MDLLLAKLEKERLGKVKTPREPTKSGAGADANRRAGRQRAGAIPAAVRRAVFERDGEQCTFLDDSGARCPQRGHLELDHVEPRAMGGTNALSNLRVRCRAHDRLAAEEVFGKAQVADRIHLRQQRSIAIAATRACSPAPPPRVIDLALRGLHSLGFSKSEAKRAVSHVSQGHGANGDGLDVRDLLRGAIAALT
jgi:5-methylcytosine-specific restriction endonuclease McrA